MEVFRENDLKSTENEPNTMNTVTSPGNTVRDEGKECVENKRTQYLREALSKVVQKCLESSRFSVCAKAYKKVYKKNPKALRSIVQQFIQNVETELKSEIETMFNEENLSKILSEFDNIISEAPDSPKKRWRPSGDPEKDIAAHTIPELENHVAKLEQIYKDLHDENKQLASTVLHRRKRLMETVKEIQDIKDEMIQVGSVIDLEN